MDVSYEIMVALGFQDKYGQASTNQDLKLEVP